MATENVFWRHGYVIVLNNTAKYNMYVIFHTSKKFIDASIVNFEFIKCIFYLFYYMYNLYVICKEKFEFLVYELDQSIIQKYFCKIWA